MINLRLKRLFCRRKEVKLGNEKKANGVKLSQNARMILLNIAVYLGFCAGFWMSTRGVIAGLNFPRFFANDIMTFFIAGLLPTALYQLFIVSAFRLIAASGVVTNMQKHKERLSFFVIGASLVSFGIKWLYWLIPLAAPIVDVYLDFFVYAIALTLYFVFTAKHLPKERVPLFVTQLSVRFLTVFAVLAITQLIVTVV